MRSKRNIIVLAILIILTSSCSPKESQPIPTPSAKSSSPGPTTKASLPTREPGFDYKISWQFDPMIPFSSDFERVKIVPRLNNDSKRFDLNNSDELALFGNYVGQQLGLTEYKTISMTIVDGKSKKTIFSGELKDMKDGSYRFFPAAARQ